MNVRVNLYRSRRLGQGTVDTTILKKMTVEICTTVATLPEATTLLQRFIKGSGHSGTPKSDFWTIQTHKVSIKTIQTHKVYV